MNILKEKLRKGECIIGGHVFLKDPMASELMASLGYDFIWVDTEHSAIGYSELEANLIAVHSGGCASLVRTPWADIQHVKRCLEQGPDAVVFPQVHTPEDAEMLMKLCIYPPYGTRGFGPIRALRYGLDSMDDYAANIVENTARFIQIESVLGVKNLPEMVKNPYIDGFIFGPNDLAASIGHINHPFLPEVQQYIDEGIKIIHDAGKCVGVSTASDDPEVLKFWYDKGMDIISAGTDFEYIREAGKKQVATLRDILSVPRKENNRKFLAPFATKAE